MTFTPIHLAGFILDTIGKVLVAYTSIMVHHRFRKEHKVDEVVFTSMKHEQVLGLIGLMMIVIGASIEFFAMFTA